jgi:hypothetical protein
VVFACGNRNGATDSGHRDRERAVVQIGDSKSAVRVRTPGPDRPVRAQRQTVSLAAGELDGVGDSSSHGRLRAVELVPGSELPEAVAPPRPDQLADAVADGDGAGEGARAERVGHRESDGVVPGGRVPVRRPRRTARRAVTEAPAPARRRAVGRVRELDRRAHTRVGGAPAEAREGRLVPADDGEGGEPTSCDQPDIRECGDFIRQGFGVSRAVPELPVRVGTPAPDRAVGHQAEVVPDSSDHAAGRRKASHRHRERVTADVVVDAHREGAVDTPGESAPVRENDHAVRVASSGCNRPGDPIDANGLTAQVEIVRRDAELAASVGAPHPYGPVSGDRYGVPPSRRDTDDVGQVRHPDRLGLRTALSDAKAAGVVRAPGPECAVVPDREAVVRAAPGADGKHPVETGDRRRYGPIFRRPVAQRVIGSTAPGPDLAVGGERHGVVVACGDLDDSGQRENLDGDEAVGERVVPQLAVVVLAPGPHGTL